jgi:hypothetical protein
MDKGISEIDGGGAIYIAICIVNFVLNNYQIFLLASSSFFTLYKSPG